MSLCAGDARFKAKSRPRVGSTVAWADTVLLNIYNRRGFGKLARSIASSNAMAHRRLIVLTQPGSTQPVTGHDASSSWCRLCAMCARRLWTPGRRRVRVALEFTEDSALGKAKALEDAIDQLTFVFKGHAVSAGASAGVALLGPLNEAAAVLEQADRAMYERKKLRRGSAPQTNIRR